MKICISVYKNEALKTSFITLQMSAFTSFYEGNVYSHIIGHK